MMMKPIIPASLLLSSLLLISCSPVQDFDDRLRPLVKGDIFSIAGWESQSLLREAERVLAAPRPKLDDGVRLVTEYFSLAERIKALESVILATGRGDKEGDPALEAELTALLAQQKASVATVERIMEQQIREILSEQAIFNPLVDLNFSFPPLNFSLEKPPYLLVVSPRDKIESVREITINPTLGLERIEAIEGSVDGLGVSSLVVSLGGLGATYPTMVDNRVSLPSALEIATEEWLHQYLVLTPLGFLYLLDVSGLSRDYDIATINETLASMVSREIGDLVYQKYYAAYEEKTAANRPAEPEFDFNQEMRETRKAVDDYLSHGKIESAEEFMAEKRHHLEANGYYIRKLNQAYFAFYGTYADNPAFISPIGLELKELRSRSDSLKDFLDTVAVITKRDDLSGSVSGTSGK